MTGTLPASLHVKLGRDRQTDRHPAPVQNPAPKGIISNSPQRPPLLSSSYKSHF
jgi:hypothetical protein